MLTFRVHSPECSDHLLCAKHWAQWGGTPARTEFKSQSNEGYISCREWDPS